MISGCAVERAVVAVGDPYRSALTLLYVNAMPLPVIGRHIGVRDPAPILAAAHQLPWRVALG